MKQKMKLLALSAMITVLAVLVAINPFGRNLVDPQTTASVARS